MAQNKILMHSPLRSLEFYCFQPRSAEQKLETATTPEPEVEAEAEQGRGRGRGRNRERSGGSAH